MTPPPLPPFKNPGYAPDTAFFPLDPFSIVLWLILCRETVFRTVKNDKNNGEVFGNSVKKRFEAGCVREEPSKMKQCQVSFLNQ